MTNSELTEELLIKSHSLGITEDVYSLSKELREINPRLDFDSSIELAYRHLTKQLGVPIFIGMKKVNTLEDIQNKYPEEKSLTQYVGQSVNGLYPKNSIKLTERNFDDIIPMDGNFKVIFSIDGQRYASNSFLQELKSSNNPYINNSNIATINLSSSDLKSNTDFSNQEEYAEVSVDKNISNVEEIASHISWLLDSAEKEIKDVSEYGSYSLKTTSYDIQTKSGLGFEYSDKIENV